MKRLISLFLMMCIFTSICVFIPITANAAASGTCGDNLTWVLDDNGTLTITGTGDMWDWSYEEASPLPKQINSLIIENGITKIGNYAFKSCQQLTNVSIPDSVKSIGDSAFYSCISLESIRFGTGILKIGTDAFDHCFGLKNVYIKDLSSWCNVELGSMLIPFYGVNLYINNELVENLVIPNDVTNIKPNVFANYDSIKNVTIPDNVENISDGAFLNCFSLQNVHIGNGVKVIEGYAFRDCNNIKNVVLGCGVECIGERAFNGCTSLSSITIPDSLTVIGDFAFWGCQLKDVYYGGNPDEWGTIDYSDGGSNYSILNNATLHYDYQYETYEKKDNEANIDEIKNEYEETKMDRFPDNITLDYYDIAGREWIELYDIGATVEIEDENVARLEDGIVVAEIGSDTADYISKQIVPVSPGKTTITAYLSDGTTKKCNLTVTGINIMLNGQPIVFDQPPINQNGNLLVPIRMIAENMGKEVLWSNEANAAFIDNTNNALIVPIGETSLYLGDEKSYSKWETVKTNVPSQVINGRTLVPIRQFSEALGAKVDWIDKYSTATISYDNVQSEGMSGSLFDAINLNYYIGTDGNNPFTWYTDNVVNPFYDSRNPTIDKITMGIGKPWTAVTELFAEIYGDTNASINLQKSLYEVLNEVPEDASYDLDLSLLKDLKEYAESGLTLFDEAGGLSKDFLDNHKSLEALNDSLMKVAQSDTTGKVFEIFDWTVFTAEELAYWLSDYSANISYLDALENALYNQGMLNSHMQHAIADLRIEYSNKFLQTLFDIWDQVVDKGFSAAMKIATGNAYGLGKVAWGTIFNATGVTKKGEALKSFYSLYCYNGALDREFSDVMLSSKDNVDIAYVNALINLQKATKTVAINSISDMANWWAKDEVNQSADELKTSLNSWSYYTWWNTNAVNNGGNNGGGGGSW